MRFVWSVIKSLHEDGCLNLSENISFCSLLAVIPMSMFMVSTAGYFLGASDEAFKSIVEVAAEVLPVGRELFVANLQSVLDKRASLGIISIVTLLFVATLLFGAIERALDVVFKTRSSRNFLHSRLLGVALLFWVTVLFSVPTMIGILEGLLNRYGFHVPLSEIISGKTYFFLVGFLAYLMMIVVVPNRKVYVRYGAVGGLFFSMGMVAAKLIFSAYLSLSMHKYNVVYGSLAAIVLFVLWIYYLSVLMLLSAELVAKMQERRLLHFGAKA